MPIANGLTATDDHIRTCVRSERVTTSQISPYELGSEESVYAAALASLARMQTPCVDLLLIHWPGKHGVKTDSFDNAGHRLSACAFA